MSQGNPLKETHRQSETAIKVNLILSGNATEQLATVKCNPFCTIPFHPISDEVQLEILNNEEKMKRFFRRDVLKEAVLYRSPIVKDNEYIPLCKTLIIPEYPTAAEDSHGMKHFLLNPRIGEYMQRVDMEQCQNEGKDCSEIKDHMPPGTSTRCETQFFRRGMVAVNPLTLKPYEIVVRVPSGCNCLIQHSWATNPL